MKKAIVVLIPLLIVIVAILFVLKPWKKKADAAEVTGSTAVVERGTLEVIVSSTGKVVANQEVEIKCKASGTVILLPYDVSETVKKDAVVMELDPIDEQRYVNQANITLTSSKAKHEIATQNLAVAEQTLATDQRKAQAALVAAQARFDDAKAKAGRIKELLGKKLASEEELETANTAAVAAKTDLDNAVTKLDELKTQEQALEVTRQQVKLAQAQVDSDLIALDLAKQRLADTKVTAPIDGVVSSRDVQVGQIIASGVSNVGGGTAAMTISDLSHIFVLADVDESDIGKIVKDQAATVTVEAQRGKKFEGKVVQIATKGISTSNVVTFRVKIEVTSEEKNLLKPEMTATVEILTQKKDNVLIAPMDAVVRKGGKTFAVLAGPAAEERPIETGINDGVKVEIVSGLNEGDQVVVSKNNRANSQWRGGPPMPMMGGRH